MTTKTGSATGKSSQKDQLITFLQAQSGDFDFEEVFLHARVQEAVRQADNGECTPWEEIYEDFPFLKK